MASFRRLPQRLMKYHFFRCKDSDYYDTLQIFPLFFREILPRCEQAQFSGGLPFLVLWKSNFLPEYPSSLRASTVFWRIARHKIEKDHFSARMPSIKSRKCIFLPEYSSTKREGRIFANILPYQNEEAYFSPELFLRKMQGQADAPNPCIVKFHAAKIRNEKCGFAHTINFFLFSVNFSSHTIDR